MLGDELTRRKVLKTAASTGAIGGITPSITLTAAAQQETETRFTRFSSCSANGQSNVTSRDSKYEGTASAGFNPDVAGPSRSTPEEGWRIDGGVGKFHSPILDKGAIYAVKSRPDSQILAINPESGERMWETSRGGVVSVPPAVGQNRIYTAHDHSVISATNVDKTERDWEVDTSVTSISSLFVSDEQVIHGTSGSNPVIGALDAQSGEPCWEMNLSSPVREVTGFAVQNGVVYFSGFGVKTDYPDVGIVGALDPASQEVLWKVVTPTAASGLSTAGETVYVRTQAGVHAVGANTGSPMWNIHTHGGSDATPTVVDDTVYVGGNFSVLAVDSQSGTVQWRHDTTASHPRPVVAEDTVYFTADAVAGRDAIVAALDRSSGTKRWSVSVGQRRLATPTVNDESLHVTARTLSEGNPGADSYEPETSEIITYQ